MLRLFRHVDERVPCAHGLRVGRLALGDVLRRLLRAGPQGRLDGRISLALTVYLGVIFFQIMIVESLPRTNAFTTMHLFMFLSSVFNGIIVLEHVLVYALNVLVAERAGRVLRIKKLKLDVRAVRREKGLRCTIARRDFHSASRATYALPLRSAS